MDILLAPAHSSSPTLNSFLPLNLLLPKVTRLWTSTNPSHHRPWALPLPPHSFKKKEAPSLDSLIPASHTRPPSIPARASSFSPDPHPSLLSGIQIQRATESMSMRKLGARKWGKKGLCRGNRGCGGAEPEQEVLTLEHSRGGQSPLTKTGKAQKPGKETKKGGGTSVSALSKHSPTPPGVSPIITQPPGDQQDPVWPAGKVLR